MCVEAACCEVLRETQPRSHAQLCSSMSNVIDGSMINETLRIKEEFQPALLYIENQQRDCKYSVRD